MQLPAREYAAYPQTIFQGISHFCRSDLGRRLASYLCPMGHEFLAVGGSPPSLRVSDWVCGLCMPAGVSEHSKEGQSSEFRAGTRTQGLSPANDHV